jgi:hypothetical protein
MRAVQIFNSSSFLRYIISLSQDTYLPFPRMQNNQTEKPEEKSNRRTKSDRTRFSCGFIDLSTTPEGKK